MQVIHDRLPDFVNTYIQVFQGSGSIAQWINKILETNRIFLSTETNTSEEGDVIPITTQDFQREDVTTTDYYITYDDNSGGDTGGSYPGSDAGRHWQW